MSMMTKQILKLVHFTKTQKNLKKENFMAPFMDGVQLPQGWSHLEEAVCFLPLRSQKSLVIILSISEG